MLFMMVKLGWKIIRFWFTLLFDEGRLLVVLVHVVRDRPEIVEELAVNGPTLVLSPNVRSNQVLFLGRDRLPQCERPFTIMNNIAEPLVRRRAFVGGSRGRRKPPLVDAATLGAPGGQVVCVQLEPAARHQARSRHPGWGQTKHAAGRDKG